MIRRLLKWLGWKLKGKPVPEYLSGKGRNINYDE